MDSTKKWESRHGIEAPEFGYLIKAFQWDVLLGQITWFPFLTGCAAANNTLHQPLTPAAEVIQRPCWKSASSFGSDQAEQWMEPPRHELTIFMVNIGWMITPQRASSIFIWISFEIYHIMWSVSMCVYIYIYIIYIYKYMYTYLWSYVFGGVVYIYIYTCAYTHTYIYIYTQQYLPRTNMAYVRFWVGSIYKLHSSFLRSWACHVALPSTQWKILISDRNIICK